MFQKSFEYYAVLAGMALWLVTRDAETESIVRRIGKTVISGLLAVGLSPTLAPLLHDSEAAACAIIMAFALIVLDVATGLIADRDLIRDVVRRRLGGGRKDD